MALDTEEKATLAELVSRCSSPDLTFLIDELKDRQRTLRRIASRQAKRALRPNTRVRLFGIKPLYMNGLTGTVKEIKQTKAVVYLDEAPARRFSRTLNIPVVCLEILEPTD